MRVWRRWFIAATVGEFVGFAVPAITGAVTADAAPAVVVGTLLAAGAVEGAVLGGAQALVLRRVLPGFSVRRWVLATSVAATLAWAIGVIPMLAGDALIGLPAAALIAIATVLGGALLLTIGTAQWLVLRRYLRRSGSWIAATALAWLGGLAVFAVIASPLWQPGQPVWLVAAIGALAGLAMAAVASAVTGFALVRLLDRDGVYTVTQPTHKAGQPT
jgi:hypothetical protein